MKDNRVTLIISIVCSVTLFAAIWITTSVLENKAEAAEYIRDTRLEAEQNRETVIIEPVIIVEPEPEKKSEIIVTPVLDVNHMSEPEPTAPISDTVPLSWELQQVIVDNCEEYGLDVCLVLGIMQAESDFNEESDNGICYGLMQIHKGNKGWVRKNAGVTDIYDSAQNIRAGCWILSEGIRLHGDIEKALVWYNTGKVKTSSSRYSRNVLKYTEAWTQTIENTAV